jgi:hypothetical protein
MKHHMSTWSLDHFIVPHVLVKATLFLFVGLQLFHPQNHGGIKIKIKSQYFVIVG